MTAIAGFGLVVLDCPDPSALAEFYGPPSPHAQHRVGALTGWSVVNGGDDWVQLVADRRATIAFQRAPDHEAPGWPDGTPQQAHLDFDVSDLDTGEDQGSPAGGGEGGGPARARRFVHCDRCPDRTASLHGVTRGEPQRGS